MSASDAASHSLPLRNCYWVVPGLLLAGEHPNGPTRDKTKDRLKKLLDAGIECFVDLTKPTELLQAKGVADATRHLEELAGAGSSAPRR